MKSLMRNLMILVVMFGIIALANNGYENTRDRIEDNFRTPEERVVHAIQKHYERGDVETADKSYPDGKFFARFYRSDVFSHMPEPWRSLAMGDLLDEDRSVMRNLQVRDLASQGDDIYTARISGDREKDGKTEHIEDRWTPFYVANDRAYVLPWDLGPESSMPLYANHTLASKQEALSISAYVFPFQHTDAVRILICGRNKVTGAGPYRNFGWIAGPGAAVLETTRGPLEPTDIRINGQLMDGTLNRDIVFFLSNKEEGCFLDFSCKKTEIRALKIDGLYLIIGDGKDPEGPYSITLTPNEPKS